MIPCLVSGLQSHEDPGLPAVMLPGLMSPPGSALMDADSLKGHLLGSSASVMLGRASLHLHVLPHDEAVTCIEPAS